jgi:uncharacterized protein
MTLITRECIDAFYQNKRIAVIGTSRDKRKYGRQLFEALLQKGFEAIAVNPNSERIGDHPCYRSITEISQPVDTAIAVVPPAEQERIVRECAVAGIERLWLHEHVMKGLSNPKAIYLCEEHGIEVISGYCPFMFMPKTGFPHNVHGFVMKVCGALPT